MASNPPGACCGRGFRHSGTTTGTYIDINGNNTYATGNSNSKKLLVVLTDVFGNAISNPLLLADQYAEAGYFVVVPDLFNNDPFDGDVFTDKPLPGKDLKTDWLPNHMPDDVKPIVDKFVDAVLEKFSPEYVATIGYCFGAKFSTQLLGSGKVHVAALAHPSFTTIEEIKAIKGPIIILGAEIDPIYTEELRHQTEDALKEIGATYFTTLSSGVEHGFSVRGDPADENVKFAKEKAFNDSLQWFERFAPKKVSSNL